jgi:hypothetical protein
VACGGPSGPPQDPASHREWGWARLARRDEGADWVSSTEKQRRPGGFSSTRMQRGFCRGLPDPRRRRGARCARLVQLWRGLRPEPPASDEPGSGADPHLCTDSNEDKILDWGHDGVRSGRASGFGQPRCSCGRLTIWHVG